jgi:hypothetical protein
LPIDLALMIVIVSQGSVNLGHLKMRVLPLDLFRVPTERKLVHRDLSRLRATAGETGDPGLIDHNVFDGDGRQR